MLSAADGKEGSQKRKAFAHEFLLMPQALHVATPEILIFYLCYLNFIFLWIYKVLYAIYAENIRTNAGEVLRILISSLD